MLVAPNSHIFTPRSVAPVLTPRSSSHCTLEGYQLASYLIDAASQLTHNSSSRKTRTVSARLRKYCFLVLMPISWLSPIVTNPRMWPVSSRRYEHDTEHVGEVGEVGEVGDSKHRSCQR